MGKRFEEGERKCIEERTGRCCVLPDLLYIFKGTGCDQTSSQVTEGHVFFVFFCGQFRL